MGDKRKLTIEILGDSKDVKRALDDAEGRLKGFGTAVAGIGKVIGVGAIAAVGAAGVFAKSAISSASDLSESLSKVNVVFGDSAQSVIDWSKQSAEAFGQSQKSALEAAGTYGNLFQAFGIGQKPAQEMSQSLVQLAADLASFNNTSVEDALAALQSGISGETEPLKKFGVALSDVRLKEEAMSLGLIKSTKDALTPAAKAQASYSLIMKDTTLAQGDFARTSDGLANKQRILAAKFEDVKAKIGTALLPIMLKLVSVIADKVMPVVGNMWEGFIAAFNGDGVTSDGIVGVAERIGVALRAVVDWVRDNWPQIKQIFMEVVDAIAGVVTGYLIPALRGVADALQSAFGWLMDHEEVLIGVAVALGVGLGALFLTWAAGAAAAAAATIAATAPIIAIGVAVAAAVAGVIYAYEHWDWFRKVVDGVASFVKDTLWPALQMGFNWLKENVPPIISAVVGALQSAWEFSNTYIIPVMKEIGKVIADVVVAEFKAWKTAIETAVDWLQKIWDKSEGVRGFLMDVFKGAIEDIKLAFTLMGNAVKRVVDWLESAWEKSDTLRGLMAGAFKLAVEGIKGAFSLFGDILGPIISAIQKIVDLAKKAIDLVPKIPKPGVPGVNMPWDGALPGFASGGRPPVGKPSVVGEDGPEIFWPDTAGTIIPNPVSMSGRQAAAWAGGSTMTLVQLQVIATPGVDRTQLGRELIELIQDYERTGGAAWRQN